MKGSLGEIFLKSTFYFYLFSFSRHHFEDRQHLFSLTLFCVTLFGQVKFFRSRAYIPRGNINIGERTTIHRRILKHSLLFKLCLVLLKSLKIYIIWRPPSLSELTPYQITSGLTHLGSEASKYCLIQKLLVVFTKELVYCDEI